MNNTFEMSRFGNLLRRQVQEFGKIYLISLGILVGVLVLIYFLNAPNYKNPSIEDLNMYFRYPTFITLCFLFISVTSSAYFASLGNKPRAIIEIMLPCSRIEKFLAGILFSAILTTISFLAIFFIMDQVMILYISSNMVEKQEILGFWQILKSSDAYPYFIYPSLVIFLLISSLYMTGSIYFEKYHFLKTSISLMIIISALSWAIFKTSRFLFDGKFRKQTTNVNLDGNELALIISGVLLLVTLFIWYVGFVRLKEKEV
ncbi:hypothetical protein [Pedobacter flavus]|uniref:ABC transporter permease n=1 Tax=Pedobacter flavus TaxID=3113906 RepID=A0ABU7GZ60_9SPHI|nr:hypothetical protein [Pedobacter sp. VNH31]MEE1884271.1 hypothetical protein [Pedobacter sp. VNH31]